VVLQNEARVVAVVVVAVVVILQSMIDTTSDQDWRDLYDNLYTVIVVVLRIVA